MSRTFGKAIVAALYRFKADTGLWPQYIGDLTPEYLEPGRADGWRYTWFHYGYCSLTNFADFPHSAVQFRVGFDRSGLSAFGHYAQCPVMNSKDCAQLGKALQRQAVGKFALADYCT